MRVFVQNEPTENKALWVEIDGEVIFVDLRAKRISRSYTKLNGLNCDLNITELVPSGDKR